MHQSMSGLTRLPVAMAAIVLAAFSGPAIAADGEAIYYSDSMPLCMACHDTGAAGAPRVGEPGDWDDRLGKGVDGLAESVLQGMGTMPAYNASLSEAEAHAAVEYMIGTLD